MVQTPRERVGIQFGVSSSDDLGREAMARIFRVFPLTRIYLSHFDPLPVSNDSAIMNLDSIRMDNSDLHASSLRVDPSNFKLLCLCILVSTAPKHPGLLMASNPILALEEFLRRVAAVLISRNR